MFKMAPKRAMIKKEGLRKTAIVAFKGTNLRYLYLYFSGRHIAAKLSIIF